MSIHLTSAPPTQHRDAAMGDKDAILQATLNKLAASLKSLQASMKANSQAI